MVRFISLGFLIFVSCTGTSYHLEETLQFAGSNRPELEKVLAHYKQNDGDSQKYHAAKFLIANMYTHFACDTSYLCRYRPILAGMDTIVKLTDKERAELTANWNLLKQKYPLKQLVYGKTILDIHQISASFLIADIDEAMDTWNHNPYRDSIAFQDFIEYVIPYRKQRGLAIENWRSFFHEKHADYLTDCYPQTIIPAIDTLLYQYRDYKHSDFAIMDFPYITYNDVLLSKRSLCEDRCWFNTMLLSSVGIPSAIDYVAVWGNRSSGHVWNSILFGGKSYAFEPFWDTDRWKYKQIYNNTSEDIWWGAFRLPKVYRYTYEIQSEGPVFNEMVAHENIPPFFRNPNQKDVSHEYFTTHDVTTDLTIHSEDLYCYLCVLNNRKWVPIEWGIHKNGKAHFKNMGCGIVYLPVFYKQGVTTPAGDPFLIKTDGSIRKFLPDLTRLQEIEVTQTQPLIPSYAAYSKSLAGGIIQGANKPDFSDAENIAVMPHIKEMSVMLPVSHDKQFRYIRFIFPKEEVIPNRDPFNNLMFYGNIAELICYRNDEPITIKAVLQSVEIDHEKAKYAFDGLQTTYILPVSGNTIPQKEVWIGVDLGEKMPIQQIEIFPANGDVYLYKNDIYELSFWHNNEWQILGSKKAGSAPLPFHNVPENALLFLSAPNDNIKERIFTFENGQQVWW